MEVLKFDIFGKFAFFNNPDSNIGTNMTFDQITKTHLLGILGAIIGLRGRQQQRELGTIEWWEELKSVNVAILPHKAMWRKFIDVSNNATGYANKRCTQIIKRQILEDVRWTVYIDKLTNKNYWDKLVYNLQNKQSEYPICLGNNNYFANIDNVNIVNIEKLDASDVIKCDSLFEYENLDDIEEYVYVDDIDTDIEELYVSKQMYPTSLNKLGLYKSKWLMFTNSEITIKDEDNLMFYKDKDKIFSFI